MIPQGVFKLAWRIGLPHYESEEAFTRLLQLVRRQRPLMDELALFETITHHQYTLLEIYGRRLELAGRRLQALRQAGAPNGSANAW